jgi:hypothetical protein
MTLLVNPQNPQLEGQLIHCNETTHSPKRWWTFAHSLSQELANCKESYNVEPFLVDKILPLAIYRCYNAFISC